MEQSKFSILSLEQASGLPGVMLWNTAKLWQKYVHEAVASLGLSSTNAVILVNILHLSLEGRRISQVIIAELSNVDSMTTSHALRTLERKQMIVRKVDHTDRRSNLLELTQSGHTVALQAVRCIAQAHQQFFGILAQDQARFSDTLSRLLQAHSAVEVRSKSK